ncbi:MAG: stage 0 sporulation family protein [Bacilli bacterium]|nr:stage 0 sporulation family protein [Bacilli bacterium]
MLEVVGVQFNKTGRVYYFSCENFDIKKGQEVIVQTERGIQFAFSITDKLQIEQKKINFPLKSVLRVASLEDKKEYKTNLKDAEEALEQCKKMAERQKLDMNLIEAEYTFDRNQLVFYFFSENRVDFRKLAKDLASMYKTRIELRQVGVRDKAKQVGGVGVCGRTLCCSSFLDNLDSVSINMAKNQNISLNPNKINGACGRLLCCLKFENDVYEKNKKDIPYVGERIKTKKGEARVISIDILSKKYKLLYENNEIEEIKVEK